MFKNVVARFVLRATLVGVTAVVVHLQASLPGLDTNEILESVLAGYLAASTYAGIGVLVPQVEPSIGIKAKGGKSK